MSYLSDADSEPDNPERRFVKPPLPDLGRWPYGDRAAILAEATDDEVFATRPTVVCCPNCAEVVATYETGLPAVVAQCSFNR